MADADRLAADNDMPRWDFKTVDRSLLSDYDQKAVAYGISDYLHHCTGIPSCRKSLSTKDICAMCGNAVRLVLQAAEPKIIDAVLKKMARSVGRNNIDLHPRVADDIG